MEFTFDDVLKDLHKGFWWEFSDWDNRIYANLRVREGFDHTLPTEAELNTLINQNQIEYDAQEYARNRELEYPSTGDQLDYIFHNGVAKWKTDIVQPVKDKYPKPS